MQIQRMTGNDEIAVVYVVDFGDTQLAECVESLQPPRPRHDKWVLMVSTLFGCPIRCQMCDAGGLWRGRMSAGQILDQIRFLICQRYPDGHVPCRQLKIQFARMGEPALNPAVLDVLEALPGEFTAPGLIPSVSSVMPAGTQPFFHRLRKIKDHLYANGHFQLQFSIHTTDPTIRRRLIPCRSWTFDEMAELGVAFYKSGDRKITLNFALMAGIPVDGTVLRRHFDPDTFLIKLTPMNPTCEAVSNSLQTGLDPFRPEGARDLANSLEDLGFEVRISVGETAENQIGSNCGQYVRRALNGCRAPEGAYSVGALR